MTDNMISFTKNEQDIANFAKLISYKMFHDEEKVPNICKAMMVNYNHYNFGSKFFDNLCWLTLQNFFALAFEDLDIKHESTSMIHDFKAKGACFYEYRFISGANSFMVFDATANKCGQAPMDVLTTAVVSMSSVTGCRKCNFSGDSCIECADGKLHDLQRKHPRYKPFDQNGWPVVAQLLGAAKSASVIDLASFYYKWLTDFDFRLFIFNNPDSWASDGNFSEFLEDVNARDYWMKQDDEVLDRYDEIEEDEEE